MNTEQTEEQAQSDTQPAPGEVLKQAREKMGWSVRDVADRLRLRVSVIEDLEQNNPDMDQLATFTRGYLRSYAKLMQIDADQLLGNSNMEASSAATVQKMQSFSRKTRRQKSESRLMWLSWVIIAIAVGITGVWYWQNQQAMTSVPTQLDSQQADELVTTPSEQDSAMVATDAPAMAEPAATDSTASQGAELQETDAQDTVNEPVSSQENRSVSTESESGTAAEPVQMDETTTQIDPEAQPTAEDEAPASTVNNRLVMTFSGDCWIDVRDANGERLATGIKSEGEQVTLTGDTPYQLVLGAPSVVKITFNGDNIDLDGFPTGQVARLRLPQ
ncbi:cytoskeleton protein RodZ [Salinivibrio kushneri]|uniref:Cytoskeleton protein RodZ n=1 Tax=Salinivibrio kushneri TaxID=1908198 RepID=A0AA47LRE2_9GAMM|nr:cytoskeleton protein RodZ [Salinivibrio kushneri]WBA08132.1 cytoskeleton protein RodZ [Salinivibrio kushneri]